MGEVKARVKLVNAGDETLVRSGLLKADQVRYYEADALVDTGACRSVIPAHACQHPDQPITKVKRVRPAHARS